MRRFTRRRAYEPGLAPGTLQEKPPEGDLRIGIIDYSKDAVRVRENASVDEIVPGVEGAPRWIRVQGSPTAELLRQIGATFSAHSLILEDINNRGQRIKTEDHDTFMFTVLRPPRAAGSNGDDVDLSILLTPTTLITVYEGIDEEFFGPILARLRNPSSLIRSRKVAFLFHAIVDLVVDLFFPLLLQLEDQASDLETIILERADEHHLRGIHILRADTRHLRGNLWATRDVISQIERNTHRFLDSDTLFYFRDIHDHVVHQLDAISSLRDTATSLMELYASGVSNRMNEVMKVLTIISTVFIPITFIAGIYGMNFVYMPELESRTGYPIVLGVMAVVVGAMLVFFKRRRWF